MIALLLVRLIGQCCMHTDVCRRRLSSVTLPVCGPGRPTAGRMDRRRAGGRARGLSGGRHCTAVHYGYVPLGRHLVFNLYVLCYLLTHVNLYMYTMYIIIFICLKEQKTIVLTWAQKLAGSQLNLLHGARHRKSQHSQEWKDKTHAGNIFVARDLALCWPQNKWVSRTHHETFLWQVSMSSSVILDASVFDISCGKTDTQTNDGEDLTPPHCHRHG